MLHGYNPPHRYLPYLSWTEIADLPDKENTVIVLPTGATEQHGPHLPCAVDTVISAGVVGHALARLPADVPAFAMAPITYGKSEEHLHFPGTVTLSGETLLATMNEVGESVYRAGFRKLLFVNGHGGASDGYLLGRVRAVPDRSRQDGPAPAPSGMSCPYPLSLPCRASPRGRPRKVSPAPAGRHSAQAAEIPHC